MTTVRSLAGQDDLREWNTASIGAWLENYGIRVFFFHTNISKERERERERAIEKRQVAKERARGMPTHTCESVGCEER